MPGPITKLVKSDLGKPKKEILSLLAAAGLEVRAIPRNRIAGDFYFILKDSRTIGEAYFCDDGTLTGFSESIPGDIHTFTLMSADLNKRHGTAAFVATSAHLSTGQLELLTAEWKLPGDHLSLSFQIPNGKLAANLAIGHGDGRKCWQSAGTQPQLGKL